MNPDRFRVVRLVELNSTVELQTNVDSNVAGAIVALGSNLIEFDTTIAQRTFGWALEKLKGAFFWAYSGIGLAGMIEMIRIILPFRA